MTAATLDTASARLDTVSARLARRDSVRALAAVTGYLRMHPGDAGAWHLRGLVAWGILGHDVRTQEVPRARDSTEAAALMADERLHVIADVSLRQATVLAPDSARYWLDLGDFLTASTNDSSYAAGRAMFERAIEAAGRGGGGARGAAEMADRVGRVYWRLYETVPSIRVQPGGVRPARDSFVVSVRLIDRTTINIATNQASLLKIDEVAGVDQPGALDVRQDFAAATAMFERAARADPDYLLAERHYYVALAESGQWRALSSAAQRRAEGAPQRPLAWLALGLATQRLGDPLGAEGAFDRALALLVRADSTMLADFTQILGPEDSVRYVALDPAGRRRVEQVTWRLVDPLWSVPGNELRAEMLARVTFAELRWTPDLVPHAEVPEAHDADGTRPFGAAAGRGARSDPGVLFVRYGPPPIVRMWLPYQPPEDSHIVPSRWLFENGAGVTFGVDSRSGIPAMSPVTRADLARQRAQLPVRWTNVSSSRERESIAVHAARFRARVDEAAGRAADSADLYVAAAIPAARLLRGSDGAPRQLETRMWVLRDILTPIVEDSALTTVTGRDAYLPAAWRRRLPAGSFIYRVEARRPGAVTGAKGASQPTGTEDIAFPLHGFGLSDLLVAERVAPRTAVPPVRWSDFLITPSAGRVARGGSCYLLWETYGLTRQGADGRYRVSLVVREVGAAAPRSMLGSTLDVIRERAPARDPKTIVRVSYERQAGPSDVTVDWFQLRIPKVDPGSYLVMMEVRDLASGRTARRSTVIDVTAGDR